jgi:phosphopantetheinyl transferase
MNILKCSINDNIDFNLDKMLIKNKYTKYEYFLIKKGLKEYYNIDNFNLYYTDNGKPYLDNNICISISHDEDIVVCVFDTVPIGVDIQFYKEINPTFKNVLGIYGNDKETTDLFSKKEAILKLNGDVFKNINKYNLNDYYFETIYDDSYVINCAYKRS